MSHKSLASIYAVLVVAFFMNSSVTLAQSVSDSPSIDPPTTKLVSVNTNGTASGNRSSFDPTLSANGRFVTFVSTATDLVDIPTGNGGQGDVYMRGIRSSGELE